MLVDTERFGLTGVLGSWTGLSLDVITLDLLPISQLY